MTINYSSLPQAFYLDTPTDSNDPSYLHCSHCNKQLESSNEAIAKHMFSKKHIVQSVLDGCLVPNNEESYYYLITTKNIEKSVSLCVLCPEFIPLSFVSFPIYSFYKYSQKGKHLYRLILNLTIINYDFYIYSRKQDSISCMFTITSIYLLSLSYITHSSQKTICSCTRNLSRIFTHFIP